MTDPTTAPSIRDSLEEVIETATQEQAQDNSPSEAPAQVEQVSETAAEGQQDLNAIAEQEDKTQGLQQRERDEQGKFKKQDGIQPGPKSGPQQKPDRAPASWKPEVREHWAQLPEGVRAEVARRESEVARTLQESAEARKNFDAVMRTIQPYEAFIKAEGSNPLQAIDNLMSTAARLRTGTAPELAQMVAGMVQQFGIGRFGNNFIELLDNALAGSPQVAQQNNTQVAVQQAVAQQLRPVQQFMSQFQQFQQRQAQAAQESARNEVSQFLQSVDFGEDVRQDMADIMEMANRRGQNITLQEAYERAVMLNPSTSKVMQQRQQAQTAQQRNGVAQRAKQAAVSVSGSAPVGALRQEGTDIRSAIEAAIAMNSR